MPPENLQPQDHPNEPILEAQLVQSKQIGEETNALLETIIHQGEQNNPEPLLEAQITQSQRNTEKLIEALKPHAKATSKMASFLFEMKGEKGDKGDIGERGEKGEQGDSIRGEKGDAGEQGVQGNDGLDGRDGRDGRDGVDGKDGENGADGKVPTINYLKIIKEVVKLVPEIDIDKKVSEIIEKVSINTNDTLQTIRQTASKTVSLKELDDVNLSGLTQTNGKYNLGSGGGSSITIEDEGTPLTQRSTVNFTGAGVTVTDAGGKTVVDIPGGAGSGIVETIVAGTGITVDDTDPANPVVSATGGGGSGITRSIITTSGNVTAGAAALTDYVYKVAGAHTVTLPTAVGNTNQYDILNQHTADISLATTLSQTIHGSAAPITLIPDQSLTLQSDGANWIIK